MICSTRFMFSGVNLKGIFGLFSGVSRCYLLMPPVCHPGNVPQRLPRSAIEKWNESPGHSMACPSPIVHGGTDSVEGAMSSEEGRVGG